MSWNNIISTISNRYSAYKYLYYLGDACSNYTNGWEGWIGGVASAINNGKYLTGYLHNNSSAAYVNMFTISKVDVTNFSKLQVHFTNASIINIGLATSLPVTNSNRSSVIKKSIAAANGSNITATLDISNITGSYYIGIDENYCGSTEFTIDWVRLVP